MSVLLGCASNARIEPLAVGEPGHPAVVGVTATHGALRDRLPARDDANLVVLYSAEEMGSLDTCGCAERPRGSPARVVGYRAALRRAVPGVPDVLVDAGNWLDDGADPDGALHEDAAARDAIMAEAVGLGGWDAVNVGWRDAPFVAGHPVAGAVSANLRGDGYPAWRTVQAGDLRVAITGVSGAGLAWKRPVGVAYADPIDALTAIVPQMRAEADVILVLAYDTGSDTQRIPAEVPGIDVLIEADAYTDRSEPVVINGTIWVRAHDRTLRLGELRLRIVDGHVVGAMDRQIDTDDALPEDRAQARLRDLGR